MRKNNLWIILSIFSILVFKSALLADVITLNNGVIVKGKIQGTSDGKVDINTDFAGKISVAVDKIQTISSDSDVYVTFESGETVFGTLMDQQGRIKVRSSKGILDVSSEKIKAVWLLGQHNPLAPPVPERKWKYQATFDLNGKTGNSEKITTAGSLKATLETQQDTLLLYLRGERSKENGEKSAEEIVGGMDYESRFLAPHSWYVRGELEKDKIENLNLRATAAVGYGYYFINEDWHELRGRLGFQIRHESFENEEFRLDAAGNPILNAAGFPITEKVDETETSPALDLGLHHRYHIKDWGKLLTDINYAPSLDDNDNYRIYHETSLEIPLAASKVWGIRLGVTNEYNNFVAEGSERLDTTYFFRLVLNWE